MDKAEKIVEELNTWLQLRKKCRDDLKMLSKEFEEIFKKASKAKAIGRAAMLLTAGLLTISTEGLAALALVAALGGTRAIDYIFLHQVENINSSAYTREAKRKMEEDQRVGENIERLTKELKNELSHARSSDEDQNVFQHILKAFAKTEGLTPSDSFIKQFVLVRGMTVNITGSKLLTAEFMAGTTTMLSGITTISELPEVPGGIVIRTLLALVIGVMNLAKTDISEAISILNTAADSFQGGVNEVEKTVSTIQAVVEEMRKVWPDQ